MCSVWHPVHYLLLLCRFYATLLLCFVGISSFQPFMIGSAVLRGAQAEKPDQRGAQQQELTAAQPSMPWSQILESLELTEHQRNVCSQIHGPPWTESCAQSQVLCKYPTSAALDAAVPISLPGPSALTTRHSLTDVGLQRHPSCERWDADMAACPVQSLVAARNMVVQRLRAITDERRRLMAALHSFVLQVGTTQAQAPRPATALMFKQPRLQACSLQRRPPTYVRSLRAH